MPSYTINSDSSMQAVLGEIRELYRLNRFVKVTAKIGKARSLDQNALSHAWYEQIARELREDDVIGWKSYCKLHHGVPILRAEDEEFRTAYDLAIKGLSYEKKLAVMRMLPVTSLMTKEQLSKYLVQVKADFLAKGVMLGFPDEYAMSHWRKTLDA